MLSMIDRLGYLSQLSRAVSRSPIKALESLNLAHLWVIYPGDYPYPLSKQITVWPLKDIVSLPKELRQPAHPHSS